MPTIRFYVSRIVIEDEGCSSDLIPMGDNKFLVNSATSEMFIMAGKVIDALTASIYDAAGVVLWSKDDECVQEIEIVLENNNG